MPQGIIDRLETIEIEKEHGQVAVAPGRVGHGPFEMGEERISIGQTGEAVVGRQEMLPPFRGFEVAKDSVVLHPVANGLLDGSSIRTEKGDRLDGASRKGGLAEAFVLFVHQTEHRVAGQGFPDPAQEVEVRGVRARQVDQDEVRGLLRGSIESAGQIQAVSDDEGSFGARVEELPKGFRSTSIRSDQQKMQRVIRLTGEHRGHIGTWQIGDENKAGKKARGLPARCT